MKYVSCLHFACLCLLLLCPSTALAQSGDLQGTTLAEGSAAPLPGIHITLEDTPYGTTSGLGGAFRLTGIPTGHYTVVARSLGFETVRQAVTVVPDTTVTLTFILREQPIEIPEIVVERVMMTGGSRGLQNLPGSAHYLSPRDLERHHYDDIHRVLSTIPGVNLQEEDGYGLRPNIGLRGTGAERSAKITVMEDGVLSAPAPYAAPAAYYFPTTGRMQGVEVRKGASQIKYGPYTTGGALNLISAQIPEERTLRATILAGNDDNRRLHAGVGDNFGRVGFLVETYQARADGFKQLDGGGNTGFDKQDYLARIRFNTRKDARIYQALSLKAGRTSETSNETYLGLTDADFNINPLRRYAGSQRDVMEADHRQFMARHVIRPTAFLDITTTLYRTTFSRNWYKLDRVRTSTGNDRLSIADVLDDPAEHAEAYALLTGLSPTDDHALEVKANNRDYEAQGFQTVIGFRLGDAHDLEAGVRYHRDAMDRFQWIDLFQMEDGVMKLDTPGTPGTESNRVESATALASYLQYRLSAGRWTVMPGIRHEHITLERKDYGKRDPERTESNLQARRNVVDVVIPGLSLGYAWTPHLNTFAGVHKGFSPPGSAEGTRPEASVNYEAGLRYHQSIVRVEAVIFFNDYSNLLGADLAASGGQGTTDLFNGGAVDVSGLEFAAAYNLGILTNWRASIPLTLTYTFTNASFQKAFQSDFEPWGAVQVGDAVPYVSRHQLSSSLGLENRRGRMTMQASYVSRMPTQALPHPFPSTASTDQHLVFDLSADYALTRQVRLFANIRNLTDASYIVARRPAGVRPGLPRTFLAGLKLSL